MKTAKQSCAKTQARQTARLSCRISEEAYQRLFVAAVMGKTTASGIVERALLTFCREWSLPGKISGRGTVHDRVTPDDNVSQDAPARPSQVAA